MGEEVGVAGYQSALRWGEPNGGARWVSGLACAGRQSALRWGEPNGGARRARRSGRVSEFPLPALGCDAILLLSSWRGFVRAMGWALASAHVLDAVRHYPHDGPFRRTDQKHQRHTNDDIDRQTSSDPSIRQHSTRARTARAGWPPGRLPHYWLHPTRARAAGACDDGGPNGTPSTSPR